MNNEELCEVVHKELSRLKLKKEKPSHNVSQNGIYFWQEEGEFIKGDGYRITRIGINEKPNRLHGRIKEHYSNNREGSTFRKHLGAAIMGRDQELECEINEWYKARKSFRFYDKKFIAYEAQVTNQAKLGGYRVLKVDDQNERRQLEEKLIALLSHCKHCKPSKNWLGNHAYRQNIRDSGLWNIKYVYSMDKFALSDLFQLTRLIEITLREERTELF